MPSTSKSFLESRLFVYFLHCCILRACNNAYHLVGSNKCQFDEWSPYKRRIKLAHKLKSEIHSSGNFLSSYPNFEPIASLFVFLIFGKITCPFWNLSVYAYSSTWHTVYN